MEQRSYVTENGDRITFMRNNIEINIQITSGKIGKMNFTIKERKQLKEIGQMFSEVLK